MDFNKVFFYILYKQIERMHNFTSWAFKKDYVMPWSLSDRLRHALVFEWQEGQH